MACGCGGASARRQAMTVTTGADGQASVTRQPTPGMPNYRVTAADGTVTEFATWNDARLHKARHGGKLRAV